MPKENSSVEIDPNQVVVPSVQPASEKTMSAISPIQQTSEKEIIDAVDEEDTISEIDQKLTHIDENDSRLTNEDKIAFLKDKIFQLETKNMTLEIRASDMTKTQSTRNRNKKTLDLNLKEIARMKDDIKQLASKTTD